jgi:hypothetical protein
MQSDDQFRLAFDAATARLDTWAERHRDCAHVALERSDQFWRLSVTPHAANACPVELILHSNAQCFDVQFGPEAYEAQPIVSFDGFEPLLDAVVTGHVITRQSTSAAGGLPILVETIVQPADRIAWIAERRTTAAGQMVGTAILTRDRHWVPYRRG